LCGRRVQERQGLVEGGHLPDLTPIDFALFPRAMPAARSGACNASSVAVIATGCRTRYTEVSAPRRPLSQNP